MCITDNLWRIFIQFLQTEVRTYVSIVIASQEFFIFHFLYCSSWKLTFLKSPFNYRTLFSLIYLQQITLKYQWQNKLRSVSSVLTVATFKIYMYILIHIKTVLGRELLNLILGIFNGITENIKWYLQVLK